MLQTSQCDELEIEKKCLYIKTGRHALDDDDEKKRESSFDKQTNKMV